MSRADEEVSGHQGRCGHRAVPRQGIHCQEALQSLAEKPQGYRDTGLNECFTSIKTSFFIKSVILNFVKA